MRYGSRIIISQIELESAKAFHIRNAKSELFKEISEEMHTQLRNTVTETDSNRSKILELNLIIYSEKEFRERMNYLADNLSVQAMELVKKALK